MPEVAGSEIHDDPFAPVSALRARALVAERGDATRDRVGAPRRPLRREARDARRLDRRPDRRRRPDEGRGRAARSPTSSPSTSACSRARNRGIFCINELPDLTEKVQVGLFNVMEERDVQVKGYRVRLPLDVLVVASANPEDYTSRGRIITPLKDRYAAQIRTHYPPTRELELASCARRRSVPAGRRRRAASCPPSWRSIVAETHASRRAASPDVNQALGRLGAHVDRELRDARRERAAPRAARSASAEAVPRISDLDALAQLDRRQARARVRGRASAAKATSCASCVKRATQAPCSTRSCRVEGVGVGRRGLRPGLEGRGRRERCRRASTSTGLDEIAGPARRPRRSSPAATRRPRLASAIEFLLEGLHLSNRLNKTRARARRALRAASEGLALQPLGRHARTSSRSTPSARSTRSPTC